MSSTTSPSLTSTVKSCSAPPAVVAAPYPHASRCSRHQPLRPGWSASSSSVKYFSSSEISKSLQQIRPHRHLVFAGDGDVGNHVVAARRAADQQHLAPRRVHPRVIVAGVAAPAFGALQRGLGDAFADQQHGCAGRWPGSSRGCTAGCPSTWMCLNRSRSLVEPFEGLGDFLRLADDARPGRSSTAAVRTAACTGSPRWRRSSVPRRAPAPASPPRRRRPRALSAGWLSART